MDAKTSNTVVRILSEEIERMQWRIDYEKKRADEAEEKLAAARERIEELEF